MSIRIMSPPELGDGRENYRVWVDAEPPPWLRAHAMDRQCPELAPSSALLQWRARYLRREHAFAVYYALELDTVDAGVFDTLSNWSRAAGLVLISFDGVAATLLKQYIEDWIACDPDTRAVLHRRVQHDAELTWGVYRRARATGVSRDRALNNARTALRWRDDG